MADLRVSVVVIALNETTHLQNTLESLQPTLPADSEVIVVDDGSTDGCSDFLGQWLRPVRVFHTDHLGVAKARNFGASQARADVVVFADAHVTVSPGWWEPLVDVLQNPRVGAVGPAILDMNQPSSKGYGYRFRGPDLLDMHWLPLRSDCDGPYQVPQLCGCFVAMRRDVLEETGGFDAGMIGWGLNDSELSLRLWALGYELWVVPRVEVLHLFRESFPYGVAWTPVIHNALRLSMIHFGPRRLAEVVRHYCTNPEFPEALATTLARDVCARRVETTRRRVCDSEAVFEKFGVEW